MTITHIIRNLGNFALELRVLACMVRQLDLLLLRQSHALETSGELRITKAVRSTVEADAIHSAGHGSGSRWRMSSHDS